MVDGCLAAVAIIDLAVVDGCLAAVAKFDLAVVDSCLAAVAKFDLAVAASYVIEYFLAVVVIVVDGSYD